MAYEGPQICIPGLVAGADYSAATNQFKFVKLSAAKTVVLCTATTDKPIGVLQNRPLSGAAATVCAIGVTKVRGGADLAFGDTIGTDTSAQAVAYANGTDTTKYIVGHVIEDNAASGGYATALIDCASPNRGA